MTDYDTAHGELSYKNRKLVSEFYSGVATGEPANPARLFHPDVTVHEPYVVPWGGTYVGMDGQKEVAPLQSPYLDPTSLQVLKLWADGENVVSVFR
jgi:ketosteroid isomerase-like protein